MVLQLFPFGWRLPGGSQHREEMYSNMVETVNGSYHRWANARWDHAYLRR